VLETTGGLGQVLEKTLPSPVADQAPEENYDVVRQHYEELKCHVKVLEVCLAKFNFIHNLIFLMNFYSILNTFRKKLVLVNVTTFMRMPMLGEEPSLVRSKSKINTKRRLKNLKSCC